MNLLLIGIIIYSVIGLTHGIIALKMQKKHHPNHIEWWRMITIFFINSVGFPICMPWAASNNQLP
jgi:Na+/H+ antiporter NhaA